MNDWITVVLLGIIEGLTEFLPISSTGHLLLAQHWLAEQSELFNVVIQCGAVLAVIAVFSKRVKDMVPSAWAITYCGPRAGKSRKDCWYCFSSWA